MGGGVGQRACAEGGEGCTCTDEVVGEGQALIPSLGCGGVKGEGGEVKKGVLAGNPTLGGRGRGWGCLQDHSTS